MSDFIRWFADLSIDDIPLVGGKNASLGEMVQELGSHGILVPNGFAVTVEAYREFMHAAGLDKRVRTLLLGLDKSDIGDLQQRGKQIRAAILDASLPAGISDQITAAYRTLCGNDQQSLDVAVRSSATAEDLPDASFAGQQETYLNVEGERALLETCKRCFASLFTDRAISYREDHGFGHLDVALSIGVQMMERSDLGTSGVMFSIDTETGFENAVLISAAYGLGENVVQGAVNPDEYYVFKPTLKAGYRPILRKRMGSKEIKMIYDDGGGRMTRNVQVSEEDRSRFALLDDDILTLARWACVIEDHYSQRHDRQTPMDIEWAKDGRTGELFIVQARPETVQATRNFSVLETFRLKEKGRRLVAGRAVGERIGRGVVRIVRGVEDLAAFQEGDVLVSDKTDPDWEPTMKKASAIVTNRGGRTCHAAIVSRELGLPAVVGALNATEVLTDGQTVTVSCAEGESGNVYEGLLEYDHDSVDITDLRRPQTQIMMNVANPDEAFRLSQLPNDGVGLAREEFIVTNSIGIHPKALIEYDKPRDPEEQRKMDQLTASYHTKTDFFVERLAHGIAMIAAAFYPKPVILRCSDFKTNEYANLLGGAEYEPHEENPMIGFRGASRYYDERYADCFALECHAISRVRDEMGLTNLKVMIPFCRTPEEGRRVLKEMDQHGLRRGENDLEVYVMCEVPSNVMCADQFAEIFDGFSIGSNDLTQLTLGVDRDSEIVSHIFDEREDAVTRMIKWVVKVAKATDTKIGICGQAPSDYPEFAEFLVKEGIDSISLNPDSVIKTTMHILEVEDALQKSGRQSVTSESTTTSKPPLADIH